MLSKEEIAFFIQEDNCSDRKNLARVGERYYEGEHDILRYRLFYYDANGEIQEDKIRSNIKASKNPGMELPRRVKALVKRSINLSLLIADNIPRGIDIIKVISMALPANFIV